jgi:hypothetical protein
MAGIGWARLQKTYYTPEANSGSLKAVVAQSVERPPVKRKVNGSNPFDGATDTHGITDSLSAETASVPRDGKAFSLC